MIAGEAPVLLGKACELMIQELTTRAWYHTEKYRRKTLQKQDLLAAVADSDVYDFLIDILPQKQQTIGLPGAAQYNQLVEYGMQFAPPFGVNGI